MLGSLIENIQLQQLWLMTTLMGKIIFIVLTSGLFPNRKMYIYPKNTQYYKSLQRIWNKKKIARKDMDTCKTKNKVNRVICCSDYGIFINSKQLSKSYGYDILCWVTPLWIKKKKCWLLNVSRTMLSCLMSVDNFLFAWPILLTYGLDHTTSILINVLVRIYTRCIFHCIDGVIFLCSVVW